MGSSFEKYQKRRLISSYFSVVVSIALVLFLLGILGVLLINAKFISDEFKEKVILTIYLEDASKPIEINQLKNSLTLSEYVKQSRFISKDAAADFMKMEYGEDFLDEVGYNPLKNSIEINLLADYVTAKRLDSISEKALQKNFVEDVTYDKDLVELMNSNVKRLSLWILIICGIFTIIAILLINSSIQLHCKRLNTRMESHHCLCALFSMLAPLLDFLKPQPLPIAWLPILLKLALRTPKYIVWYTMPIGLNAFNSWE